MKNKKLSVMLGALLAVCLMTAATVSATVFACAEFTVTFKSGIGIADVTETVEEGGFAAEAPEWTTAGDLTFSSWRDQGGNTVADPLAVAITGDTTFIANWTVSTVKKVDATPWTAAPDKNGWDTMSTTDNGGYFDSDNNALGNIGAYGHFVPGGGYSENGGQWFANQNDPAKNLVSQNLILGSLMNYKQLDVSKEIIIYWSQETAEGWSDGGRWACLSLHESVEASLKTGGSNWNGAWTKLTFKTSNSADLANWGQYANSFTFVDKNNIDREKSGTVTYKESDAATNGYLTGADRLQIFISEDGNGNYAALNGFKFSDLAGVSRSDFPEGYAYLMIGSSGATTFIAGVENNAATENTVSFE
ncbi:MAG: hypothetical protein LBH24_02780, partial [Clostridiales bacterium]|nr:hypothetical protein [Clostridiales bacterium]